MWEDIYEITDKNFDYQQSSRLMVPGGWLIRTVVKNSFEGTSVHCAQTFIEDRMHEWKLGNCKNLLRNNK